MRWAVFVSVSQGFLWSHLISIITNQSQDISYDWGKDLTFWCTETIKSHVANERWMIDLNARLLYYLSPCPSSTSPPLPPSIPTASPPSHLHLPPIDFSCMHLQKEGHGKSLNLHQPAHPPSQPFLVDFLFVYSCFCWFWHSTGRFIKTLSRSEMCLCGYG